MIIRELEVENIRSYAERTRVEFGPGITLIEGDIGSGKSSLLMAIEFALFGYAESAFYERLLRKGASRGYVRLKFEVNGRLYEVERRLRKTKSGIKADRCYLREGENVTPLSPTSLRTWIMRILGIKSEGRKRVPVFHYAFYTPQEMMKRILEENDEVRTEMIKKVFRLDEYRIIIENAEMVISEMRAECRGLEERAAGLDERRKMERELVSRIGEVKDEVNAIRKRIAEMASALRALSEKKDEMERKRKRIEEMERRLAEVRSTLKELRERMEAIEREIREAEDASREAENLLPQVKEYDDLLRKIEEAEKTLRERIRLEGHLKELAAKEDEVRRRIDDLDRVKEEVQALEEDLRRMRKRLDEFGDIDANIEEHQAHLNEARGRVAALRHRLRDLETEYRDIATLSDKKECPRCRQPLSEKHMKDLVKRYRDEIRGIREEIKKGEEKVKGITRSIEELKRKKTERDRLERRATRLEEKISAYRERLGERAGLEKRLEELREKRKSVEEKLRRLEGMSQEHIEGLRRKAKGLEPIKKEYLRLRTIAERGAERRRELSRLQERATRLVSEEKDLLRRLKAERKGYSPEEYEKLREEYERLLKEISGDEKRVVEMEKFAAQLDEELRRVREEIRDKEDAMLRLQALRTFMGWLAEKFIPAMERLEEIRTEWLRHAFNELFQTWVGELLQETEYEARIDEDFRPVITMEDYEMPINTLSGGERTTIALAYRLALNTLVKEALRLRSHMLILDEPTEGFSKDQLHKLKDVFERVKAEQVIIVSHERELENLADRIYLVSKSGGVSTIEVIG